MERTLDRRLALAWVLGAVSLALSVASLTIAVTSVIHPPVSKWLSIAQNAGVATQMKLNLLPALLTLAWSLMVVASVTLRRPLLCSRQSLLRAREGSGAALGIVVVAMLTLFATLINPAALSFAAERAAGGSITDSSAFSAIGLSLGSAASMTGIGAFLLLGRWWRLKNVPPQALDGGSPAIKAS